MSCDLGFVPSESERYYFLSYNKEDAARVSVLAQRLVRAGVPIWYDRGLKVGDEWEIEISRKISQSQAVLLFFTKSILDKQVPYTRKEYRMASVNFGKKICVVELDRIDPDCVPYDKVPWWDDIQTRQNIKAADYAGLDELVTQILAALPASDRPVFEPSTSGGTGGGNWDGDRSYGQPKYTTRQEPVNPVVAAIMAPLRNRREDKEKLTTNYDALCRRYYRTGNLVCCDNAGKPDEPYLRKQYGTCEFRFPISLDAILAGVEIHITDSQRKYKMPEFVAQHFGQLLGAHKTSILYNNLNIRVDNWHLRNDAFVMETSRTTYYDSLVTNRAMDYKLGSGTTVREMLEYMPGLASLDESKLSNHLGFNGFVESGDGYIPFVRRDARVSVGKRTLGTSIGASLKTKYALNERNEFDMNGLLEAIRKEVEDELCIPATRLEPFTPQNHHIIAAYRDLVEGGKPQLLFYVRSSMTMREIDYAFQSACRSRIGDMTTDGTRLVWLSKDELKQACVAPDAMICQGDVMKMVPSTSASVVMLQEYFRRDDE